jgi:hypothetical protein
MDLSSAVTPQELDAWLRSTDVDDAGGQQRVEGEGDSQQSASAAQSSPPPPSSAASDTITQQMRAMTDIPRRHRQGNVTASGEREVSLDYIKAALHAGHEHDGSSGVAVGRGHYHQECSVSPLGVNDAPSPAPQDGGGRGGTPRHVNRDAVLSQMKPPSSFHHHTQTPSLKRHASFGSCRSTKTSASHDTVPVRNNLERNRSGCYTPTEPYDVAAASSSVNSPYEQQEQNEDQEDIMTYGRSASLPISFDKSDAIQEEEEEEGFDPRQGTLLHSHSMPTPSPHRIMEAEQGGSDYFLSAMAQSQKSQEHPVHSRRSMGLMMETSRSRGMLFQAMQFGIGRRVSSRSSSSFSSRRSSSSHSPLRSPRLEGKGLQYESSPYKHQYQSSRTKHMIEQDMKNVMLRTLEDEYLSRGKLDLPVHLPSGSAYASSSPSHHHHAFGSGYWRPAPKHYNDTRQQLQQEHSSGAKNFSKMNEVDKESAIKAELQRIAREQMMEEMGVSGMSF